MLEKLLLNASIKNKTVTQYQFKSPYQKLANLPKNADIKLLCAYQDSNLGPHQYQWCALPTELYAQACSFTRARKSNRKMGKLPVIALAIVSSHRRGFYRIRPIFAAKMKSFSVNPLTAWVDNPRATSL